MKRSELLFLVALLAVLALVPLLASNLVINFLVTALIVALAALGWNILGGLAGQISFGHAAFFGTGAYVTELLQLRFGMNAWAAAVAGIAAGALMGLAIGAAVFRARLRGSYFALVTLAFAEVLRILTNALDFTGGASGLLLKLQPGAAHFQFDQRSVFAWIGIACVGGVLLLTRHIMHSRFGAQLAAVLENEDAARALGVDIFATKLRAITLSAAITAAAGVFYVQYFLYLDANIGYGTWISIEALLAAIIGGVGTMAGPLIGALALHGLGELTRGFAGSITGIDLVIFGLLLVAAIAFAPAGIVGAWKRYVGGRRNA